jgi:hypothetical protein
MVVFWFHRRNKNVRLFHGFTIMQWITIGKKFEEGINLMRKQGILFLGLTFIFTLVLITSCIPWTGYPSGPIKWTFVSGDGSWNTSSRKWTVSFAPGETKTATIQLDNTGSKNLWVVVVLTATDYIIFHMDGPWAPPSGNVLEVLAGGSSEFKISGTDSINAPHGNHKYVVNFNWSTNESYFPNQMPTAIPYSTPQVKCLLWRKL